MQGMLGFQNGGLRDVTTGNVETDAQLLAVSYKESGAIGYRLHDCGVEVCDREGINGIFP